MTRDTRIGLVTGLAIILLIGALLSMYLDHAQSSVQPAALSALGSSFRSSLITPPTDQVPPAGNLPVSDAAPAGPASVVPHQAPGQAPGSASPGSPPAAGNRQATVVSIGNVYQSGGGQMAPAMPAPPGNSPIALLPVNGNANPAPAAVPNAARVYVVKPGDTLTHIAWLCYHDGGPLAVGRIIRANSNELKNRASMLHIGEKLIIPPAQGAMKTAAVSAPRTSYLTQMAATTSTGRLPGMHRAQQAATQLINGFFPKPAVAQAPAAGNLLYRVKPHDTLAAIARRYMGSASMANIRRIMQANHIRNPNRLFVGMKLNLPAKGR